MNILIQMSAMALGALIGDVMLLGICFALWPERTSFVLSAIATALSQTHWGGVNDMAIFQMAIRYKDTMTLSLPSYPPHDFSVGSVFDLGDETWRCIQVSEDEITVVLVGERP